VSQPAWEQRREHVAALHAAALLAADPGRAVRAALVVEDGWLGAGGRRVPLGPGASILLVAAGKAAIGMAAAALDVLGGRAARGIVAHPAGVDPGGAWPEGIRLVAAGHPLPDEGSLAAGRAALDLLAAARPGDVVLALLSGGGSALLEAPRPGVRLDDLRRVTLRLQRAGVDIIEINTVRRALSRLKGGGLARAAGPARVVSLLLSDVVGDDPAAIASGPTVASPTGAAEARTILARHGLVEEFPRLVAALGGVTAPPGPRDDLLAIVGSNRAVLEAVRDAAASLGFEARLEAEPLCGEARDAGRWVGQAVRAARGPACLVFGGETTVTVRGAGRGGRNQELALGAALALDGCRRTIVLAFATDGVDGPTDAAGAVVTGETIARGRALGLDAAAALAANDAWSYFEALHDLWRSGPTGTNLNDVALALVYP
jgi:hydroxypyruvate reductase